MVKSNRWRPDGTGMSDSEPRHAAARRKLIQHRQPILGAVVGVSGLMLIVAGMATQPSLGMRTSEVVVVGADSSKSQLLSTPDVKTLNAIGVTLQRKVKKVVTEREKIEAAKRAQAIQRGTLRAGHATSESDGRAPDPGFSDALLTAWNKMQAKQARVKKANKKYQAALRARQMAADAVTEAVAAEVEILTQTVTPVYAEDEWLPTSGEPTDPTTTEVTGIETTPDPDLAAASAEAQAATQAALEAYSDATVEVSEAVEERTDARVDLREAQITYGTIATEPVPAQTTVGPDGCPTNVPSGGLQRGAEAYPVNELCAASIAQAATPQAAAAIRWAFTRLGAPYACGGYGRMDPYRFDCSSLVSRAYYESSGIPIAGDGWALTTRQMMPWGGSALDPHLEYVDRAAARAGDLMVYTSCASYNCGYQHVVMYLGEINGTEWVLHTSRCGEVAHIEPYYDNGYVVTRRVVPLGGEAPLQIADTRS